jgi:hypothetical protein
MLAAQFFANWRLVTASVVVLIFCLLGAMELRGAALNLISKVGRSTEFQGRAINDVVAGIAQRLCIEGICKPQQKSATFRLY